MSHDYIPSGDVDLQVWCGTFSTYLNSNLAHFGLTAADVAGLIAAEPEFTMARAEAESARITYRGTVSEKRVKRESLITEIRKLAAMVQACPATTNQDRDSLGLPRRGNEPSFPQGVELRNDRPVAGVNIGTLLRHTLRIKNDHDGTILPGKPQGVKAVEVWVKVGDAPVGDPETEMRYVDTSTRNSVSVPFTSEDGNKQAHYKMRWVYSNGEKGGWSETIGATIAA